MLNSTMKSVRHQITRSCTDEFEYSRNSDFQTDGLLIAGVPGRDGGFDSGFGASLTRERRDHFLLPNRDVFTADRSNLVSTALGQHRGF